ncbi:hypothetical protein BUALT_Bualt13G0119800 [Buddleja alternifolia]|uniref:DUF4283 domain-containing protein n=1 Tax=Buddleja alternifolia TaxID=168488 RepID=A0AAV6WMM6_9LAMI|nr:hypothetical protein BUALT_Bualt13G0119800 [Buddleja alternifolia]
MTRLRAKFAALRLLKGFKVGVLDNKHVWIRLFDSNDYIRIWLKQTWYFDGFPMRVLKWMPDFDPKEKSPIVPIWVKILGFKPHWFHLQFLYHVASLIGKPLKLDESTTVIDNPTVARICIEINILDRLQQDIPVIQLSSRLASMEKTVSAENSVGLEDLTAPIWHEKGDLCGGFNTENGGEKTGDQHDNNMELVSFLEESRNLMIGKQYSSSKS